MLEYKIPERELTIKTMTEFFVKNTFKNKSLTEKLFEKDIKNNDDKIINICFRYQNQILSKYYFPLITEKSNLRYPTYDFVETNKSINTDWEYSYSLSSSTMSSKSYQPNHINQINRCNQIVSSVWSSFIDDLIKCDEIKINNKSYKYANLSDKLKIFYKNKDLWNIPFILLFYNIYDFSNKQHNSVYIENLNIMQDILDVNINIQNHSFQNTLYLNILNFYGNMPVKVLKETFINYAIMELKYTGSTKVKPILHIQKDEISFTDFASFQFILKNFSILYLINSICVYNKSPIMRVKYTENEEDLSRYYLKNGTINESFFNYSEIIKIIKQMKLKIDDIVSMSKSMYFDILSFTASDSVKYHTTYISLVYEILKNSTTKQNNYQKSFIDFYNYIINPKNELNANDLNSIYISNIQSLNNSNMNIDNNINELYDILFNLINYKNMSMQNLIDWSSLYKNNYKNFVSIKSKNYNDIKTSILKYIKEANNLTDIQLKYFIDLCITNNVLTVPKELKTFMESKKFKFLNIKDKIFNPNDSVYPDFDDINLSSVLSSDIAIKYIRLIDGDDHLNRHINTLYYISQARSHILQNTIINTLLIFYSMKMSNDPSTEKNELKEIFKTSLEDLLNSAFKSKKIYSKNILVMIREIANLYFPSSKSGDSFAISKTMAKDFCKIYMEKITNSFIDKKDKEFLMSGYSESDKYSRQYEYKKYPFNLDLKTIISIISEIERVPDTVLASYTEEYMKQMF